MLRAPRRDGSAANVATLGHWMVFVCVTLILWIPLGQSATDIASNIEVPMTLLRSLSPYRVVTGTFTVFRQAAITVEAGVTVRNRTVLSMKL